MILEATNTLPLFLLVSAPQPITPLADEDPRDPFSSFEFQQRSGESGEPPGGNERGRGDERPGAGERRGGDDRPGAGEDRRDAIDDIGSISVGGEFGASDEGDKSSLSIKPHHVGMFSVINFSVSEDGKTEVNLDTSKTGLWGFSFSTNSELDYFDAGIGLNDKFKVFVDGSVSIRILPLEEFGKTVFRGSVLGIGGSAEYSGLFNQPEIEGAVPLSEVELDSFSTEDLLRSLTGVSIPIP